MTPRYVRDVIVTGVILAVLVNLASSSSYIPDSAKRVAFWLLVSVSVLFVLVHVVNVALSILWFGKGRYAVLAFALDPQDRIALAQHPYHRRLIPPGGRLKTLELPHDAVKRVLLEEAGVTQFSFDPHFHSAVASYTDTVTILPEPHRIQREDRMQRGLVKFHYAFVYVLRAESDAIQRTEPYNAKWYTLAQVHALLPPQRPFDDIVKRYEDILLELHRQRAPDCS